MRLQAPRKAKERPNLVAAKICKVDEAFHE
jgi:hypothetical protein